MNAVNYLLDILFPQNCLGCKLRGEILCGKCIANLKYAEREPEKDIMALYDYRDPIIRQAIWNLKYYKRRHIGPILGRLMYESYLEDISDIGAMAGRAILVIPVPMSRSRKKKRGYNQAEVIARNFCESTNSKILKLEKRVVIKIKDTTPQARITNRTRRLANMKGVFSIKNTDIVRGRTFIVIDDVTTTGATIREIIKLLNKAGAKKTIGLALAH